MFVTQEAARIKLKNYENALKSFMPFLLGAGLTVIFWDMLGIYHALAEHRELVPEPFPVFGFGSASTSWFYGQFVLLMILLIISLFCLHSKWGACSVLCAPILFVDYFLLPGLYKLAYKSDLSSILCMNSRGRILYYFLVVTNNFTVN